MYGHMVITIVAGVSIDCLHVQCVECMLLSVCVCVAIHKSSVPLLREDIQRHGDTQGAHEEEAA